jgi:murein DD-endopeptidase MepM/ murein hydrolase activator NlpD
MRDPFLKLILMMMFSFGMHACATRSQEVVYRVKVMPGDTLISIATKYGTSWYSIARDNSIGDYRQVKVGDELFVRPGPGGFVARGDTGQTGFLGEVSSREWRDRQEQVSQEANSGKGAKQDRRRQPRGGFLFGFSDDDKLNWPVEGGLSSEYGPRWGRFHHGIDIRAASGTAIKSAHDGKVVFSGWRGGFGRLIVIEDDEGDFLTYYAHCRSLKAKTGDRVRRGQKIATVGSSGHATGAHLHFEYRLASGESRNPLEKLGKPTELISSK